MRHPLRILLAAPLLACTSCYGTFYTRTSEWQIDDRAEAFGWPLFEAVHADVDALGMGGHQVHLSVAALFGLPIDFAVDLVLLPLDVVAGLSGSIKNRVGTPEVLDELTLRRVEQLEAQKQAAKDLSRELSGRRD